MHSLRCQIKITTKIERELKGKIKYIIKWVKFVIKCTRIQPLVVGQMNEWMRLEIFSDLLF